MNVVPLMKGYSKHVHGSGSGFERGDVVRVNCDTVVRCYETGTLFEANVKNSKIPLCKGMTGVIKCVSWYNGKFHCDVMITFGAGNNEQKKRVRILNTSLDKL